MSIYISKAQVGPDTYQWEWRTNYLDPDSAIFSIGDDNACREFMFYLKSGEVDATKLWQYANFNLKVNPSIEDPGDVFLTNMRTSETAYQWVDGETTATELLELEEDQSFLDAEWITSLAEAFLALF